MSYLAPLIVRSDRSAIDQKRLTILFSYIEGFTRVMENVDESAVAAWINRYFCAMTSIAEIHGGTVHKFLGDDLIVSSVNLNPKVRWQTLMPASQWLLR